MRPWLKKKPRTGLSLVALVGRAREISTSLGQAWSTLRVAGQPRLYCQTLFIKEGVIVANTFNPSALKAEASTFLSLKLVYLRKFLGSHGHRVQSCLYTHACLHAHTGVCWRYIHNVVWVIVRSVQILSRQELLDHQYLSFQWMTRPPAVRGAVSVLWLVFEAYMHKLGCLGFYGRTQHLWIISFPSSSEVTVICISKSIVGASVGFVVPSA